ncbi:MAG TPA: hypothetical protein VKV74_18725 [Bryobacteraceae bacterium]|nr:hypothetical protein [Bryobacteraceae bacterium]
MRYYGVLLVAVALLALPQIQGKDKKKKPPPKISQDAIEVVGHVPAGGGTVTQLFLTQHFSSYYLYAEHEGGRNVTLIDVSDASQPLFLFDLPSLPSGSAGRFLAVAGTAALITDPSPSPARAAPQTIRAMDYSDPKQPKAVREFAGVTALSADPRRGLIFLANPDGIWILHQSLAEDPEQQKEYARRILYDR